MPLLDACPPAPGDEVVHLAVQLAVVADGADRALPADAPAAPGKSTLRATIDTSQPTYVVGWHTATGKLANLDGLDPGRWARAGAGKPATGTLRSHARLPETVVLLVAPGSPPGDVPVPGQAVGVAPKGITSTDPSVACYAFAADTRDPIAVNQVVNPTR